jgi:ribonuclease P protein component
MDESFPPWQRLHTNGDYSRVFNRQQKAAGKHAVVLVMPRSRRAGPHGRLGVMIPNKAVKTSVRRHQIKRWVKELFRRELKDLAVGHDVVVLLRTPPPLDGHAAFDDEIRHLLPKALNAGTGPGNGRRPKNDAPRPAPATLASESVPVSAPNTDAPPAGT